MITLYEAKYKKLYSNLIIDKKAIKLYAAVLVIKGNDYYITKCFIFKNFLCGFEMRPFLYF